MLKPFKVGPYLRLYFPYMWGCSLGAITLPICPHHEEDFPTLTVIALDLLDHQSNNVMVEIDSILHDLKVHNWTHGVCV